jgi:hypothetical protein
MFVWFVRIFVTEFVYEATIRYWAARFAKYVHVQIKRFMADKRKIAYRPSIKLERLFSLPADGILPSAGTLL